MTVFYQKLHGRGDIVWCKKGEASMIEIRCSAENSENKNVVAEGKGIDIGRIELPKNIRQVGNAPGDYRIYIEDYVMTYLRQIASPTNTKCRGAVLIGEFYREDEQKVLFINGAVEAQNLEFDTSLITFDKENWKCIMEEKEKYFKNSKIVGWFLSRMGFGAEINDSIKKLHCQNFPGDEQVLFLMDSLECEETFYYRENGHFVREKGYYIYYVRNELMQNYLISKKNLKTDAKSDRVSIQDKTVVEEFRRRNEKNAKKKKSKIPGAASLVAAGMLTMGALWYSSPEMLDDIGSYLGVRGSSGEIQVFQNSDTLDKDKLGSSGAELNENDGENGGQADAENDIKNEQQADTGNEQTGAAETGALEGNEQNRATETGGVAENGKNNETEIETATQAGETANDKAGEDTDYEVYCVQEGDTLVSISIKMYNSQLYAKNIAVANDMDMESPIYEGQKLVIPCLD